MGVAGHPCPHVLDTGLLALPAGPVPPPLVVAVALMVGGLALAAIGIDRTVRAEI